MTAKDDSDGDGIPNTTDADSDNDGILNLAEGGNDKDTDGDGIPTSLILTLTETDVMMLLRLDIVILTETVSLAQVPEIAPGSGLVVGNNYNVIEEKYDADGNGVNDFQEAGGPITSVTNPVNIVSSQGKKETFEVAATATSPIAFQWQLVQIMVLTGLMFKMLGHIQALGQRLFLLIQ